MPTLTSSKARFATWTIVSIVTLCLSNCVNSTGSAQSCVVDNDCFAPEVCSVAGLCVPSTAFEACEDNNCSAPTVETTAVVEFAADTLVLGGRLVALGSAVPSDHGVCWSLGGTPLPGDNASVCIGRGPRRETGEYAIRIARPTSSTPVRYRAYATNTYGTAIGEVLEVGAGPTSAIAVNASDGDDETHVLVDWQPIDRALLYRIYRDDELIGTVNAPPFVDSAPGVGGLPLAPAPTASSNEVYISVRWTNPGSQPGSSHRYQVVALGDRGVIEGSGADTGSVAGPPVESYEISVDAGAWIQTLRGEYMDVDAAAPSLVEPTTIDVVSLPDAVEVRCGPHRIVEPPARTYVVRARNALGYGDVSGPVSASRTWGEPYFRVLRAVQTPWGDRERVQIARGPGPTFVDNDPPRRSFFARYDCEAWLPGSSNVAQSPAYTAWAAECTDDDDCAGGTVCTAARCAPAGFTLVPPSAHPNSWRWGDTATATDERAHTSFRTYSILMSRYETTQGEWETVMGSNPSVFPACGPDCPVDSVTWWSVLIYLDRISLRDGFEPCFTLPDTCTGDAALGTLACTGEVTLNSESGSVYDCDGYRLPTESEWVVSARGTDGIQDEYGLFGPDGQLRCDGVITPLVDNKMWHCGNAAADYTGCVETRSSRLPCGGPQPVGQLRPNFLGIYDIFGNIGELCWDGYARFPDEIVNPNSEGPYPQGDARVGHGGTWWGDPEDARAANRVERDADLRYRDWGFRIARTVREESP